MSQDTTAKSAPAVQLESYVFDNGSLRFTIDGAKVDKAMIENPALLRACRELANKTLIHKTKSRPLDGTDGTDWFLSELSGGASAGRFRITAEETEATQSALKQFKMAPDQTKSRFLAKYGVEFVNEESWLLQHYLNVRIAKALAAKAEKQDGI